MQDVELYLTKYDNSKKAVTLQDACTVIKLSNSFTQISAELTFTLGYNKVSDLGVEIEEGDIVSLFYRRGQVFNGKVVEVDKKGKAKQISVTAYDYCWWLCKSNITKNFSDMSIKDALIEIYNEVGAKYAIDRELGDNGNIMLGNHLVIDKPVSKVLYAIYSEITQKTGLYYYMHMNEYGLIEITEADKYYSHLSITKSSYDSANGNLIDYEINRSIQNMVTQVRLYNEDGSPLGIEGVESSIDTDGNTVNVLYSENAKSGRYGTIQETVTVKASDEEDQEGNSSNLQEALQKANKILDEKGSPKHTLTVQCFGDINYKPAYGVMINIEDEPDYKDKFMYIVSSEWTWNNKNSTFISKLELSPSKHHDLITWADIETKQQEDEESSSSGEGGSDLWNRIEAELKKHLGVPYVWGGKAPPGMDCSGYIAYVYNQFSNELEITSNDKKLEAYTYTMMNQGKDVTKDFPNNLVKGDIIFPHAGHVVAYIGDNQVIHEPKTGDVCKISSIYFSSVAKVIRVIPDSAWQSSTTFSGKQIVTAAQLKQLNWVDADNVINDLNKCLTKYEINTPSRICHFISQCAAETDAGYYKVEAGSGSSAVSGGSKYKGGGYIQLTHDYNYRDFAKAMGDNKIYTDGAEYVGKNYPWSSAGWWWGNNNMNKLCDSNPTVEQVTKRVNGGYNGLAKRKSYYEKCKNIFK